MQRMRYQNFVLVWVTHKYQLTKLHTKLRFVSQNKVIQFALQIVRRLLHSKAVHQ